jgi:hypothetical protein
MLKQPLGILKIDVFKLKIPVFIVAALSRHSHYTRFVINHNIIRPKVRTNYGIQTFAFTSSKIWETKK